MKKLLVSFICALMAMTIHAQNTFNARLGYGGVNISIDGKPKFNSMIAAGLQANFPVKPHSPVTFSPAIEFDYALLDTSWDDDFFYNIAFPVHLGYKIPFANKCIFFPKAGLKVGYEVSNCDQFFIGPSAELALEINNFVVSLNGSFPLPKTEAGYDSKEYYDSHSVSPATKKCNAYTLTLSLGYKF